MRPYRGKTKDGEWVYGWYIKLGGHHLIADETVDWDYIEEGVVEIEGLIEVLLDSVAQQVGFKDKAGKEIWENSIISFIPAEGLGPELRQIAIVYYCTKRGAFCAKSNAWDMHVQFSCTDVEILGNKTDNPELLQDTTTDGASNGGASARQ